MFIYNIKINGSKIFKIFFTCLILLIVIILCIVTFKVFSGAKNYKEISSCTPQNIVSKISSRNYTNILKAVHDNMTNYLGLKINFTGYVYRVLDFKDNQFVLSRDMIISSDRQTVIVGFLCEYEKAKDFTNGTWVEVTGEIIKGNYHGDIPVVKIIDIKKTDKPNDEYVYPPDESYIPTDGIV